RRPFCRDQHPLDRPRSRSGLGPFPGFTPRWSPLSGRPLDQVKSSLPPPLDCARLGKRPTVCRTGPVADRYPLAWPLTLSESRISTSAVGRLHRASRARDRGLLDLVEAYDPATDTWTTKDGPFGMSGERACVARATARVAVPVGLGAAGLAAWLILH